MTSVSIVVSDNRTWRPCEAEIVTALVRELEPHVARMVSAKLQSRPVEGGGTEYFVEIGRVQA